MCSQHSNPSHQAIEDWIVDHALRITAEHRFAASTLLDLAVSLADFFPLRTK
jgi:hypothetical protein